MSHYECVAEFIDGSYDTDSCGCPDCGDAAAEEVESQHEAGLISHEEALDKHTEIDRTYHSHTDEDDTGQDPPAGRTLARSAQALQDAAIGEFLGGDLLAEVPKAPPAYDWVGDIRKATTNEELRDVAKAYMLANDGNGYGMPETISQAFRVRGDQLRGL
jgi:hypothetical protein